MWQTGGGQAAGGQQAGGMQVADRRRAAGGLLGVRSCTPHRNAGNEIGLGWFPLLLQLGILGRTPARQFLSSLPASLHGDRACACLLPPCLPAGYGFLSGETGGCLPACLRLLLTLTAIGLAGRPAGRLAGWLAGRLAGWLAGWFAGLPFDIMLLLPTHAYPPAPFDTPVCREHQLCGGLRGGRGGIRGPPRRRDRRHGGQERGQGPDGGGEGTSGAGVPWRGPVRWGEGGGRGAGGGGPVVPGYET